MQTAGAQHHAADLHRGLWIKWDGNSIVAAAARGATAAAEPATGTQDVGMYFKDRQADKCGPV